jgi:hypothetical protein
MRSRAFTASSNRLIVRLAMSSMIALQSLGQKQDDHLGRRQLASRESAVRSAVFFFIAELFKVVDGKINRIEALVTPVPYGMYTGWPAKK